MNLYLLKQTKEQGYDTYDSAVVAASCIEDARNTHPEGLNLDTAEDSQGTWGSKYSQNTWPSYSKDVKVELIGTTPIKKPGVILASFNAG